MGAVVVAAVAVLAGPAVVAAAAAAAAAVVVAVNADVASYVIVYVASAAVDELLIESEHRLHVLALPQLQPQLQALPSLAERP